MKNKRYIKIALVVLLCLAMVMPFVPIKAEAVPNFSGVGDKIKGKNLSILGDSISTFEGVSNDGAANSSIAGNAVYYNKDNDYGVDREDTWWQQAIDTFGMKLCVNNSWSGSMMMGTDTAENKAAWRNRCVQLHTSSANPDIIAVYLGTNDIKNRTERFPQFAANKTKMLSDAAGETTTATYEFSYYIRAINKMMAKYPSAEIYCFTLLPNENLTNAHKLAMEDYNQSIRDLVAYYQSQSKKVFLVDLYNDTSITDDFNVLNHFLANTLHPNATGMDAITNCFLSSVQKNSQWRENANNWREVTYDLTDVYVEGGQINSMLFSSSTDYPVTVSLLPTKSEYGLDVKVEGLKKGTTDSWDDLTASCYNAGTVCIKRLNYNTYSEVRITAKAVYDTKNYRWEQKDGSLESCTVDGKNYNVIDGITYNDTTLENGSYTDGSFANGQFSLDAPIILRNEEPWVLEWKASGALNGGSLLFSEMTNSSDNDNCFVFKPAGMYLFLGYRNVYKSEHRNFGVTIPSTVTLNASTSHAYRLSNQINADGTNMVYLYIDGNEIGAMNNYYIASNTQGRTDNWISGRDFAFSFFGANPHYLKNCSIEYIQVWEGGEFDTLRLEQLLEESNELLVEAKAILDKEMAKVSTNSSQERYEAYVTAINAAKAYSVDKGTTQASYDALVAEIIAKRNEMMISDNTKNYTLRFLNVELVTGESARAGKQVGVRVVTDPNAYQLVVRDAAEKKVDLAFCSSKLQYLTINGEEQLVKVWLIGFEAPAAGSYEWHIQPNGYSSTKTYWTDLKFTVE